MVAQILSALRSNFAGNRLFRNFAWLMGAEFLSRVCRIVTAIIIARTLDVAAFGIAALALTVFELLRVFTENGIGAAVIRAPDDELEATAHTAYRLMWIVCQSLASVQICAGIILQSLYPQTQLGSMLGVLAIIYLIMPFGVVQAYLLQRQQQMKRLALVATSQTLSDHLLTAGLAIAGLGPWALILPKLLTTPIWLVGIRSSHAWRYQPEATHHPVRQILIFSAPVLTAELAVVAREQADKVIIVWYYGLDILGLYYFAFNAGLGLSSSLNRAFINALYPNLCAGRPAISVLYRRFRTAMLMFAIPLCCGYLLQAAAALYYVPIIFGAGWSYAAPLVASLCLLGPSKLIIDSLRVYCRTQGNTKFEFAYSLLLTGLLLTPLATLAPLGLIPAVSSAIFSTSLFSLVSLSLVLIQPPGDWEWPNRRARI